MINIHKNIFIRTIINIIIFNIIISDKWAQIDACKTLKKKEFQIHFHHFLPWLPLRISFHFSSRCEAKTLNEKNINATNKSVVQY